MTQDKKDGSNTKSLDESTNSPLKHHNNMPAGKARPQNTVIHSIDVAKLPRGLKKDQLIRLPELKKQRNELNYVGWAAIIAGIITSIEAVIGAFIDIGEASEKSEYVAALILLILYGLCAIANIFFGILIIILKNTGITYACGIYNIVMCLLLVIILNQGVYLGGAAVFAIIEAYRFDEIWKYYKYIQNIERRGRI